MLFRLTIRRLRRLTELNRTGYTTSRTIPGNSHLQTARRTVIDPASRRMAKWPAAGWAEADTGSTSDRSAGIEATFDSIEPLRAFETPGWPFPR